MTKIKQLATKRAVALGTVCDYDQHNPPPSEPVLQDLLKLMASGVYLEDAIGNYEALLASLIKEV